MPLPPLEPSNTARIQVLYTSGEFEHTAEIRVATTPSESSAAATAQALADLMGPAMATGDSTFEARLIPEGTNVYTALAHTPVDGSGAATGEVDVRESAFISFTGRSNDGRRTRFTLFTQRVGGIAKFRQSYSEAASVFTDILDFLGEQSPVVTTISGAESHWHQYVNFGFNSHFQRKQR